MTSVTLDLPQDLYQLAQHAAQRSRQPIEQVLLDWIQPPNGVNESELQSELAGLELQTNSELIQVAKSSVSSRDMERLQALLAIQQQRELTAKEYREAERLVKQEDLQTLRKAKALYLLQQRNALPADLRTMGM